MFILPYYNVGKGSLRFVTRIVSKISFSRRPFAALAAVVFAVAETAVVAQDGGDLRAAAPFAADAAVVFAVAKSAVAAQPGGNLCRTAPLAALAAVVLAGAESTVAAQVRGIMRCVFVLSDYCRLRIEPACNGKG